ncbi:peptidase [Natrinema marinum]|uniref:peptidase n=1 Tax=Natrinema marinum TaxID=2961598 RepID=UPI0020C837C0|nr:peptidase [Natrinema marinum]
MIAATVLWFGLLGMGYVGGRLYGRYTLRRAGDGDGRSRGTYRLLTVVGLVAVAVLTFTGLTDATERALSSVHPALEGGLATPLVWLPTALGTIVAVLVAYLGVFPYARKRRGLEISARTAVARLARYLTAVAILVVGALAMFTALVTASDPSPLLIPLLFVVLTGGVYAWIQYGVRLSQSVTEPTREQRRRLEDAAERTGLTATIGGVIPGRETEVADLYLDGPFWNRRVYATDYALDALDDEEVTALCARSNAADGLWLLERRALVAGVVFGLLLSLTVWTSITVAVAGLAVAGPLLARFLQRSEFAADRRATRAVDADTLASALEAGSDLSDDRGRLHELLAARPSRARRLERLRNP